MEYKGLQIKVCGMRDTQNIDSISELHPNYLGFIFFKKSPRYAAFVNPQVVRELPTDVTPVAVFLNETISQICDICEVYGITTVQLHGEETPEFCRELVDRGFTVIKAEALTATEDIERLKPYEGVVSMFVFDTKTPLGPNGGTGRKWDWSILNAYNLTTPYLLSGGIGPEDAEQIRTLTLRGLSGVDVNSRFEISPGLKNVELLVEFINQIRHEPYRNAL